MKRTALLCGLLLLGLAGCGVPGAGAEPAQNSGVANTSGPGQTATLEPMQGKEAPDFQLPTVSGDGDVRLRDLLGKEVLVINTWASWCGPCIDEMPVLVQASQRYKGQVRFVGVNMTVEDSPADAKRFVDEHHIPYLTLLDPKGRFLEDYHIVGTPTTFILRPDGTIVGVILGPATADSLDKWIRQALSQA
jgi:cytochrome c biogenesis protein CcmG/thiol:disulfide interchange protein DsbE